MYNVDELVQKWRPVLEHADLPAIDKARVKDIATLLENQHNFSREEHQSGSGMSFLGEAAPTNAMGASSSTAGDGAIDIFDPVLISLVRRSMPNLIAYDIMGVQPMTGPTGLIFAMRSRYNNQSGTEALFNEANTSFSASAQGNTASIQALDAAAGTGHTGTDPTTGTTGATYTVEQGMSTAEAEALGDGTTNAWQEMAFSVEKVTVTAKSRNLRAKYTRELAQDLKAVHGLDAEKELANILQGEILAEINREMVRTINYTATAGAQDHVATAGTFDVDVDSNGRWMKERFQSLLFQIDLDANALAKSTRRGKGNVLICGSNLASALRMSGMLDYSPKLATDLNVDDTGNTFAGMINGNIRVYIDPYFSSSAGNEYYTIGYRGTNKYDAGLFYCPYVPLQMVRAVGEDTYQPSIGFATRYGVVANPFATTAADGSVSRGANDANVYYRRVKVTNLQ